MKRIALLLALAATGCNEHRFLEPGTPIPAPNPPPPGVPEYRLVVGQSVLVDGQLLLGFTDVPEDSRCPANAYCVWQGNAEVTLSASFGRCVAVVFTLNTDLLPRDTVFAPYRIELVGLDPYPLGPPVGLDESLARLRVSVLPD